MLATLVLILVLRSPDMHLSPRHQWLLTRITGLACLSCFLVLSAGVVLFHAAHAASTIGPEGSQPSSATASPHGGLLPSSTPTASLTPSPSPSPTPFPRLVPGPSQVLTTFCDAIDQHDLNTAWGQYAKALQKERATPHFTLLASRLSTVGSIRPAIRRRPGTCCSRRSDPAGIQTTMSARFSSRSVWRRGPRRSHRSPAASPMAAWIQPRSSCHSRWHHTTGELLPHLRLTTRKDGMPVAQQHRGHPRGNGSDRASAREECCGFSLEGGVVVAVLSWIVQLLEALR
jgi:hypothetical protein